MQPEKSSKVSDAVLNASPAMLRGSAILTETV